MTRLDTPEALSVSNPTMMAKANRRTRRFYAIPTVPRSRPVSDAFKGVGSLDGWRLDARLEPPSGGQRD